MLLATRPAAAAAAQRSFRRRKKTSRAAAARTVRYRMVWRMRSKRTKTTTMMTTRANWSLRMSASPTTEIPEWPNPTTIHSIPPAVIHAIPAPRWICRPSRRAPRRPDNRPLRLLLLHHHLLLLLRRRLLPLRLLLLCDLLRRPLNRSTPSRKDWLSASSDSSAHRPLRILLGRLKATIP